MKKDYANAYSEVVEVLKYISKEDYQKIPKKIIKILEENRNEKSEFLYNAGVPFEKQEISKDAKIILAIIYRNCWAAEKEKEEIAKKEKAREIEIQQKKREKHNPDEIFKKREKSVIQELEENHYLVEKEKWYLKILKKLKRFFSGR